MSDITFSNASPALVFSDNDFSIATGYTYALLWRTFVELAVKRAEIIHAYPGIDGVEIADMGSRTAMFEQKGWLHAKSEANLSAARTAVTTQQDGAAATLVAKGDSFTDVDMFQYSFGREVVGRSGNHYQEYRIIWRQL